MIRVLHVIKTLSLGGAETNLLNLVGRMDGHIQTHVAYSWGGEIEEKFKKSGVRLFKYAESNYKIKSLATLGIIFRLAKYILKNDIQIVHTHVFNAHVWGGIAAKITGRKVVEHVHDFRYVDLADRESGRYHVNQFRHIGKVKGLSDGVIVLTQQNREFLLENHLCDADKIWLIRNGIKLEEPTQPNIESRRRIFLTPARMSGEKNIDLLFRVVPQVARVCPEALFIVAGDGPLLESYRKRAKDERLEPYFRFIGFHADIRALLRLSYALVLPSFLELHPVSILEALSLRVPVVVSKNVGSNSEIFKNEENALLLDPHSAHDWSRALIRLIRQPEWREKLAKNGLELCRAEFEIGHVAGRIEKVYEHLVS